MIDCKRCGACCIYFNVRDDKYDLPENFVLMGDLPPKIVKPAGEPCLHLAFENGIARCNAYNSSDRWEQCSEFNCQNLFRHDAQEVERGLEETRKNIKERKFVSI